MAAPRTYLADADSSARRAAVSSVVWLVCAVSVGVLVELKSLWPGFADMAPLAWPRLRALHDTLFFFGFLTPVFFACALAVVPRVSGVQLHNERQGRMLLALWNLVLFGAAQGLLLFPATIGKIHIPGNSGRPLGELPPTLDAAMLAVMLGVTYQVGATMVRRSEKRVYVASWYLFAAVLALPVVFLTGNLPLFSGVADHIVGGFYVQGLQWLWLAPAAIGALYYVVPTATGNPLHSVGLARIGFWSLLLVGGWTGARGAIGGPVPGYLQTIAVVMCAALLLPVLTAASNLFATGRGRWSGVGEDFGMRFAATGTGLLVALVSLQALSTLPGVSRALGLTSWEAGLRSFALQGAFTALAFACLYHLYPRMSGRVWYSRRACSFHFWATVLGGGVIAASRLAEGLVQGGAVLAQAGPGFRTPSGFSVVALLGAVVFAAGQYAFASNAFRTATKGDPLHLVPAPVGAVAAS